MLHTASAYGSVTRAADGTVTGMSMTPVSMGVSSAISMGEAASQGAHSSFTNSFGFSESVQALRSFSTQTADKSMAGFTRLLNTAVSRQSGLQSSESSSTQVGESLSYESTQSIGDSFNNAQNASIRSSLGLSTNSKSSTGEKPQSSQSNIGLLSNPSANSVFRELAQTNPENGNSPNKGFENIRQTLINGGSEPMLTTGSMGQIQTSQQLIDTVSQQSNASNASQRQEAYKTLLAASRQISESTTDSGIRNAAKAFEEQLTRAYQYGNRTSFDQSATQSASTELGYVSNKDLRTMMDNSPVAMQKAIETFGSAEAAQNALFHSPTARSYFSQQLHQELNGNGWNASSPYPVSTIDIDTMARPHRQSFEDETTRKFDDSLSANQLDSSIAMRQSLGGKDPGDLPNTEPVSQVVNQERDSIRQDIEELNGNLTANRGATLSAKALYEEKQSGVPTVFANAYLGGVLYDSPEEYKEQLQEKAEHSESFNESLRTIGEKDKAELSDFERSAQK